VKVIGAGFGRTGTMSLKVALEELGAGPCFHCLDPSPVADTVPPQARRQVSPWTERRDSDDEVDWQAALAGWGSTVGWLGARFYREMLDVWPEALVLLSVRDPETWYASARSSIEVDGPVADRVFGGRIAEREHALGLYRRHNEQVMSTVPRERLLVYEVAQGWGPLSEFLGTESPRTPFPHLNRAGATQTPLDDRGLPFAVSPSNGVAGAHAPRIERSRSSTLRRGESRYAHEPARAQRRPLRARARIAGLAVADSETTLTQEEVLVRLGLKGDEFAERIFSRSGVERRHLNLSEDFLKDTLQGRALRVEDELMRHAIRAVDRLGVDPQQIGTIVSASLYSLGCPTLAHRLIDHYRMDPATDKYHITGVGCASAVPLLRLASQALPEHPGKYSLVVAAESMSSTLMRASSEDSRAKTVGSAIFGDGCAAALLSGEDDARGPAILASQVHQIGGTLGAVSLSLSPEDSHLHLDRELPDLAAAGLPELVAGFLERNRMARSDVEHWMVHPGGRRIVECVQDVLALSDDDVAISWQALADHGNIGTPSILYVLNSTIVQRTPRAGERGVMVTIGPGISVGLMLLQF
jgi:predicted naringenin-chalcone synthase